MRSPFVLMPQGDRCLGDRRSLERLQGGQQWLDGAGLGDVGLGDRFMQHPDRVDAVAQRFQRFELMPNRFGLIPILIVHCGQQLHGESWGDAAAAGGEACQAEEFSMDDRRLFANAADDGFGWDFFQEFRQVGIDFWLIPNHRVLDPTEHSIAMELTDQIHWQPSEQKS